MSGLHQVLRQLDKDCFTCSIKVIYMVFMYSRAASDKTVFGKTFFSRGSATPSGEILFINQSCDCDHQLLHVGCQLLYDMRSILKWSQPSVKPKPVKQCLRCSRGAEMVLEGWKVMHTMHCGVEISSLKAGLEFVYTC